MTYNLEFKHSVSLLDLNQLTKMQVREEGEECQQISVLDTVDWRVWRSGQVLIRLGFNSLKLVNADDQCKVTATMARDRAFAWELPEPLATELKSLLTVRALIPLFSCQWLIKNLIFLNPDEKIVARAHLYQLGISTSEPPSFIKVFPLRGYDREAQSIIWTLEPVATATQTDITVRSLLVRCGLNPAPPTTKPEFHFDAHHPTEETILTMVAELVRLARQQEEGLITDIDSEFAHQYRINLRKARSLLSLFKKALAPERYRALHTQLKIMTKTTNRLRDLDVFLLDQNNYRAMLPEQFQPGLDALFNRLRRQRQKAWYIVTETLQGEPYSDAATLLARLMKDPPDDSIPSSRAPIRKRVCRKILAQYRKIQREGCRINATTPDEQIHALRIEAKKLRYLLELFTGFYPREKIRRLIKALKRLQDNLGRFNDYSSQGLFLAQLIQAPGTTTAQRDAVNGLIAVLFSKQQSEREQMVAMIEGFSDSAIAEQFYELFSSSAVKDSGL